MHVIIAAKFVAYRYCVFEEGRGPGRQQAGASQAPPGAIQVSKLVFPTQYGICTTHG